MLGLFNLHTIILFQRRQGIAGLLMRILKLGGAVPDHFLGCSLFCLIDFYCVKNNDGCDLNN